MNTSSTAMAAAQGSPSTSHLECRACQLPSLEKTILETSGTFSVPSLGALVPGWTLAFPRRHVLALNRLSNQEWREFDAHVRTLRRRIIGRYGAAVQFEHGSSGSGRTASCGVDHAHLHIVGLDMDLRAAIASVVDEVGSYRWQVGSSRPPLGVEGDYIWLQDHSGSWFTKADILPSQVVRRAIAHVLGEPVWDWKIASRTELAGQTLRALTQPSSLVE